METDRISFLGRFLVLLVLAGCSSQAKVLPKDHLLMPTEISGVFLGVSKHELLRLRPALERAVIPYVDGPAPSRAVDPALQNDGLLEELHTGGPFRAAFYQVHNHKLATVIFDVEDDKPPSELAEWCIERWGSKFSRQVLIDKHVGSRPAQYLALEWRQSAEFAILVCRLDSRFCELVVADASTSGWDRLRRVELTGEEVGRKFKEAGWGWALDHSKLR